jgi:DNA repair photolyase
MTKAKGNMYSFVTHTHNAIKGKCPHACTYCYVDRINRRFNKTPKPPYLDEKELSKNLTSFNTIFIGSSCDMWAENIPEDWIIKVLEQCHKYPNNKYLFQTKNPIRFLDFTNRLPEHCFVGTTIETNKMFSCMGNAPSPNERARNIRSVSLYKRRFVTIEPILDFDLKHFITILEHANPYNIFIGADSGNNRLPEPEPEKIRELVSALKTFTTVHLKPNLKRLLPEVSA